MSIYNEIVEQEHVVGDDDSEHIHSAGIDDGTEGQDDFLGDDSNDHFYSGDGDNNLGSAGR